MLTAHRLFNELYTCVTLIDPDDDDGDVVGPSVDSGSAAE